MIKIPHDIGDTVPLTAEVRDAAGTLVNAASVVLTVRLPDSTTATPAVTNPSTGRYQTDYVPTVPGDFDWYFQSTTPATALSGAFHVRDQFPAYLISLEDAKTQLRISGTTVYDEELRQLLEAATPMIERAAGKVVVRRSITENRRLPCSQGRIALHNSPVISLMSVVSLDGLTTWNIVDLHVTADGILTVRTGRALADDVVITYVAGFERIPANFREAGEKLVKYLWSDKRGDAGAARVGGTTGVEDMFVERGIPRDVYDLVGPATPGVA